MKLLQRLADWLRPRRRAVPTVLQMEAAECGAASLGMVLAYFGRYEPLERLREACGVSRNGSRASLVVRAAREFGLKAQGCRVSLEALAELPGPLILFWNFDHFLVLEGCSRDLSTFYLNDPAVGPRVVDRELFETSFTGVALVFEKGENFTPSGAPAGVLRTTLPMLRELRGLMATLIWCGLLLVVPGLTAPVLLQIFVDKIMAGRTDWLTPVLLLFALTGLLQMLLGWITALLLRRGQLQISVNRTLDILNHIFRLPMSFFFGRSCADLQNRIGLAASVTHTAFSTVTDSIIKMGTALFFLVLLLQFSPLLTAVNTGFLLLHLALLRVVARRRQVLAQSLLARQTSLHHAVMTGIADMEDIRATGREDSIFNLWTGQLAALNRTQMRFQASVQLFNLLPGFLGTLGSVVTLCTGAWLVMEGSLTLGGLFAFQSLMSAFAAPFSGLLMAGAELQTMKADVDRMEDVFRHPTENIFRQAPVAVSPASSQPGVSAPPVPSPDPVSVSVGTSAPDEESAPFVSLELRHITFGYSRHETPQVEDISLTLTPGRRLALVGGSGSGKSTVARIAAGLLKPWSGEVLLNGRPLHELHPAEFYAHVGMVDQRITLFAASVRDNLTLFAPSFDAPALQRALRDACIEDALQQRGAALALPVSEGGGNFSGGQRQRMEIARALAQECPLLILDEAASALDPVTEELLDQRLRQRGCACLIVAHRLSTVRDCDEILVMAHGHVAERGSHDDLLRLDGLYARLMQSGNEG